MVLFRTIVAVFEACMVLFRTIDAAVEHHESYT